MHEIGGALGMRGGGEDGAVVVLAQSQLGCEAGRVIFARLGHRQRERRSILGNQFLGGIACIAPALATLSGHTVASKTHLLDEIVQSDKKGPNRELGRAVIWSGAAVDAATK